MCANNLGGGQRRTWEWRDRSLAQGGEQGHVGLGRGWYSLDFILRAMRNHSCQKNNGQTVINIFNLIFHGGRWEKRLFQDKGITQVQSGSEGVWGDKAIIILAHDTDPDMLQQVRSPADRSPSHPLWLVPTPPNLTTSGILRYHLLEASPSHPAPWPSASTPPTFQTPPSIPQRDHNLQ